MRLSAMLPPQSVITAREFVHHAGVVAADGRYRQMLLARSVGVIHGGQCTGFLDLLQVALAA